MTYLQDIRESLMKQKEKLENGTSKEKELEGLLSISDAITKSFNTELRAKELEISAIGTTVKTDDLDVFKDMQ